MEGRKILGVIIIIALILSIGLVSYSAVTKQFSPKDKNVNTIENILDESELNTTLLENSTDGNITTINLNIYQKTGGSKISFADNTTTIYNITSTTKKNASTNVTTEVDGDTLTVNIESNDSDNKIVLSNKYRYNINDEFVAGAFDATLDNNAEVDNMEIHGTLGGVNIKFNDGSLNSSDIKITTGGLNIRGEPKGQSTIASEIEIGGVNLALSKPVADIFTNIDVGGTNPGKYQKVSDNEYKGTDFDASGNKLIITSNIRVGGVNAQSSSK